MAKYVEQKFKIGTMVLHPTVHPAMKIIGIIELPPLAKEFKGKDAFTGVYICEWYVSQERYVKRFHQDDLTLAL